MNSYSLPRKNSATPIWSQKLSDGDFQLISKVIYDTWGIKMPPAKKTMLSSRLNKRVKVLQLGSYKEYIDYVLSPEGRKNEWSHLIDAVSTNKTDFFREKQHFDFMTRTMLPHLAPELRKQGNRTLRIWSAGCSSGEEPYTMAMVLAEYERINPWFSFSVTATDINNQVLSHANNGIYDNEKIGTVPANIRYRYFMKGTGSQAGLHRIVPELRKRVMFKRLNLMANNFAFKAGFDIIFCRNVIIYFDRPTQSKLFQKFYDNLSPSGFMFIGHSENLHSMEGKFSKIESAIYQCNK